MIIVAHEHWIRVVCEPTSAVKPLTSFLTSALRFYKDIENLPR